VSGPRRARAAIRRNGFGRNDVLERTLTEPWQLRAACRGHDSSYFFAPSYFEKRWEKDAREAVAKAICNGCPVLEECRDYALDIRESHGIWGGLNEMERRSLLRQRSREAV
jgi:WhiB family redox-sensing transcriptional regulator